MRIRILLPALLVIVLGGGIFLTIARHHPPAPGAQQASTEKNTTLPAGIDPTPAVAPSAATQDAPGVIVVQKPMGAPLPQGYHHSVDAIKKTDTASASRVLHGIDKLIDAINKEDVAAVKAEVSGGTAVNASDADGHTPLTAAAYVGNVELVEYLLAHKADVNAANGSGETPLFEAIKNADEDGAVAVSKVLIAHGAAINIKCNGVAPLELAIGNQSKQIETVLRNTGAK